MNPDVRDLLAAITEAIRIPLDDLDENNTRAHHITLQKRVSDVCVILTTPEPGLAETASLIREWAARTPVTYTPWQPTAPAGKDTPTGESTQPEADEPLYGTTADQIRDQLAGMARKLAANVDANEQPWDDVPPPGGATASTLIGTDHGAYTIRVTAAITADNTQDGGAR